MMDIQKYKFINNGTEEIWKTELRQILNRDIHEKGLGCRVNNTHVKIGEVHLGTFFEAQFLFGNAYWISIFATALSDLIKYYQINSEKRILVVGYENYIEPVILQMKNICSDEYDIDYCIYEEPRYIMNTQKSEIRLRFNNNKDIDDFDEYIIVCGISSTLNTFNQIISKLLECKKIKNKNQLLYKCCTIIQVLPQEFSSQINKEYELKDAQKLSYYPQLHVLKRMNGEEEVINSDYLVEVFCEWQKAINCKWCFDSKLERPIITTNETSVIPVQMIGRNFEYIPEIKENEYKINFFEKKDEKFIYQDYLYYNHIERDSHHYQYYIRTNALLKFITSNESENDKFIRFCNNIKTKIIKNENRVDILIVPIHFSNEHFFNEINKHVFGSSAEIINFDPKKEYRSNFETKYSNYAYVIEPIKEKLDTNIYFHYVDDQIISGNTFYRAKSFVTSLLWNSGITEKNIMENSVKIFESVITLVNRNSESTKRNYIFDIDKYFSLIDIEVPSLRQHGDSCYLCTKQKNAEKIKERSALCATYDYWEHKEEYNNKKSLSIAKDIRLKQSDELKERKFRQFYCENLIWMNLKNRWDSEIVIFDILVNVISSELNKIYKSESFAKKECKNRMYYEYLISFVKVISKPLIYYRENVKKAVLAFMLYCIFILNEDHNIRPISMIKILKMDEVKNNICEKNYDFIKKYLCSKNKSSINFNGYEIQKYYLYIVLLSRLSNINSNYLLKYENIKKAFTFYNSLSNDNEVKSKHITNYIKPFIKIITNGISGDYKAKKLDEEIFVEYLTSDCKDVLENIFLDNIEAEDIVNNGFIIKSNSTIKEKYEQLLHKIADGKSTCLLVKLHEKDSFIMATSCVNDNEFISSIINSKNKIIENDNDYFKEISYVAIKCCENTVHNDADNKGKDVAYLIISVNDTSELSRLKIVRPILIYRYKMYMELKNDLLSGAIQEFYQDRMWLEMLAHPKTISHGQSEDIKEHLRVLENSYQLYKKEKKHNELTNENNNICSQITLFSNQLISFFHTKKIAEDSGHKYKFNLDLKVSMVRDIIAVDKDDISNMNNNEGLYFDDNTVGFIEENIKDLFINRFIYYIECMKKQEIVLNSNHNRVKNIFEIISLDIQDENLIWIPIVFIHILLRNAIKHGNTDEPIHISFEKNGNYFDLIIKNKMRRSKLDVKKGITQNALRHALPSCDFNTRYNPDSNEEEYISKISKFIKEDNYEVYNNN